jgi:hypothetical protein
MVFQANNIKFDVHSWVHWAAVSYAGTGGRAGQERQPRPMPTLQVGALLTFAMGIIHTILVVLTTHCMNVQLTASSEHVYVDLVPLWRAGAQPSGPRQRLSSGRCSGRNAQCAAHPPSKHFRIPRNISCTFNTTLPSRDL